MKYFLIFSFLFFLSCSLDKASIKKTIEKEKYTKMLEKNEDFKHYWSEKQFFKQGSNIGIFKSTLQNDIC